MDNLQQKLNDILVRRSERCRDVESALVKWQAYQGDIDRAIAKIEAAERANNELAGATARLRTVAERVRRIKASYDAAKSRFSRSTLCIGIGGAARMGKSTFLQAVTGLCETQIPTSDKYFTTATRSQIENSPNENVAIVDFHSPASFLSTVIGPMCDAIGAHCPVSLSDFRSADFQLPAEMRSKQGAGDILQRLRDAQSELLTYERYLTGERGHRIDLSELRPFVAYPEPKDGRIVTAGPYLAVADLVIRAPFPSTDVTQLRVVDLPGLGEAGRNLAKVQTEGMADICDMTLLVKRPTDTNIQWTETDTNALDAMCEAVPLLDDQTKYTAILANVGSEDPERARLCVSAIRNKLERPFEIIECNARDRTAVAHDTMPRILDFMARNLPVIDGSIMAQLADEASNILGGIRQDVDDVLNLVRKVAPGEKGLYDSGKDLLASVVTVLTGQERLARGKAAGMDKDWDAEVCRTHDEVVKWVNGGCGYDSKDKLLDAIRGELMQHHDSPPRDVIEQCRVRFRAEWEKMDLHLTNRIARLLSDAMDALQGVMHGFVPDRDGELPEINAVRSRIREFADRIDSRRSDLGDDVALAELSTPLRRIAEFDLQFRFHLEPLLHATTHLLIPNEFSQVKDDNDAEKFQAELIAKLLAATDAYAAGMRNSGAGNSSSFERKKKLFEKAIPDESVRADVIRMLEQSMGSAQSFCPNRIFAAVMETFADSFIHSKNSEKAFHILAREWKSELQPAPDEKTRLTNEAAGAMADLAKKLNN